MHHTSHIADITLRAVQSHFSGVVLNEAAVADSKEEKIQRLFFGRVPLLELCPRQPPGKWHHGVFHVHDAPFLLVDVRSIDHYALEVLD